MGLLIILLIKLRILRYFTAVLAFVGFDWKHIVITIRQEALHYSILILLYSK